MKKPSFIEYICIILFFAQTSCTSFLYFPSAQKYVVEEKMKPRPKPIFLNSTQDKQLMNWFFRATKSPAKTVTVVFTHGNGQNMSAHFRSLYWLPNKGINYLAVEYPGYGPNDGTPSPETTVEATLLAIEWVKTHRPQDAIFLFGQSLGGNVMLRALSEYKHKRTICGIAVEGSFSSYKEAAQEVLAKNWLFWLFQHLPYLLIDDSKAIANNFEALPDIPYLVIHGTRDQTIPIALGRDLFDFLPANKSFWEVQSGQHIDTFFRHPFYRERLVEFIESHCL